MNLCDNKLEKWNNTILNVMPNLIKIPEVPVSVSSLSYHVKMKDEVKTKWLK